MTRFLKSVSWFTILLLVVAGFSLAQDRSTADDGWTPDLVYGKGGKDRTSQPFVVRRYKADPENPDKVAKKQPPNFVKTISNGYKLAKDETVRVHLGVDLPSRPNGRAKESEPMEFKAGIYGKVVMAGGGQFNTITVQLNDGSVVQYLHSSAVYVKKGEQVTPDTRLGLTGKTGAAEVHLHIQANKDRKPISPDKALAVGRRRPATTIEWPEMKWVDVDIESSSVRVPEVKVIDRTVRITFDERAPKNSLAGSKWRSINAVDRAGTTLEFTSATSMKMTFHLSVFGDPDKTYEYKWKQNADGSFLIGDKDYWGKHEAGQNKLELKRKARDGERTETFRRLP